MARNKISLPWQGVLTLITGIALFLGAATSMMSTALTSLPQDPLPPVSDGNIRGYWFGAEQDGKPGGLTGQPRIPVDGRKEVESIGPHECRSVGSDVQVCIPTSPEKKRSDRSPADLAIMKWTRLPIPAPRVRTAPPRRNAGLVGLPEWFWVTNWRSLGGRASAGEVWAEVNAVPQRLTIEPGDRRHLVICPGPGTAYDPSKPAVSQRTNCSYTYARSSANQPGGTFRVRVTVTWGGTWRGSDGSGGALPPLTRSTDFPLRVAEAQGLYG